MKNIRTYPIKAVSKLTGLSLHVIRAWERRYNVVSPSRTDTNRRMYSAADVEKLMLLNEASKRGYSIGNIADLSIEELRLIVGKPEARILPRAEDVTLSREDNDSDYLANSIEAVKNMDVKVLERELYRALVDLPQFRFIEEVITPLLERIGEMWKNGDIRIVNEHISTAVIRKFLTSLIDNNTIPPNAPSILVATPKGQLHELGALIIAAIASSDGWRVTYMGPDLPGEEIAAAINRLKPGIVALSIVYPNDDYVLQKEMVKLKNLLNNGLTILAGGRSAGYYKSTLDAMNAKIITGIDEFRSELEAARK
jgi:DNA-binding transcriptional MerR regulator/methylmalonyl-CoA mutase cobalamin-binding subunit